MEVNIELLKYPVGKFSMPEQITDEMIQAGIEVIEQFPKKIFTMLEHITVEQGVAKYRPDGWTVNQVVNHCADSHINAFIRFKCTLTEESPTIKPYLESKWAELPDGTNPDLTFSKTIIQGLHERWTYVLKNIKPEEWDRIYLHPESKRIFSLKQALMLYTWHCNHHSAHIANALKNPY